MTEKLVNIEQRTRDIKLDLETGKVTMSDVLLSDGIEIAENEFNVTMAVTEKVLMAARELYRRTHPEKIDSWNGRLIGIRIDNE